MSGAQDDLFCELWLRAELREHEIAARVGWGRETARKARVRLGLPPRDPGFRVQANSESLWPPERIQRLHDLWMQEPTLSAAEIGRILETSKNAVVGKAHRLGLPKRPSPIIRGTASSLPKHTRPPQPVRYHASPSLPPLPSIRHPVAHKPRIAAPPPPPPTVFVSAKRRPCCFPIGEPRTPEFRFCEAPGLPGRSYCLEHHRIAYLPPKVAKAAA